MIGAWMLLGALITMPTCCFLTAWNVSVRHLFPISTFLRILRRIDAAIAEIREFKSPFNNLFIEFADDNTFADKAHGKKLMRELAKEQVKWFTETDVSVADDEDLIKMMRDAGCHQILVGFESPNINTLNGVEQKNNWKARRADRYLKAVETIQKHGVTVNGCFILGMDGDGPESFDNVFNFVNSSGLYDVQITYLTPFPGTPLQ
jgi:radical SAM superfamily enzyme YgiQ (UPF0313 family)